MPMKDNNLLTYLKRLLGALKLAYFKVILLVCLSPLSPLYLALLEPIGGEIQDYANAK